MNLFRTGGILGIPILLLACAPAVYTHSTPRGLSVSGDTIKYGEPETTLVTLSVKRQEGGSSWKASFTDGTASEIVAEDISGLTILKWKVEKDRLKTLTKEPFKLTIKNGDISYDVTVSFTSAGRNFTGQLVVQVIARLIAGR